MSEAGLVTPWAEALCEAWTDSQLSKLQKARAAILEKMEAEITAIRLDTMVVRAQVRPRSVSVPSRVLAAPGFSPAILCGSSHVP